MNIFLNYIIVPLMETLSVIVSISPFILFCIFTSIVLWIEIDNKKRSKKTNIEIEELRKTINKLINGINNDVTKLRDIMSKYQIMNEHIISDDFAKIETMLEFHITRILDIVVNDLIKEYMRVDMDLNPFDVADIISDELQMLAANRTTEMKSRGITARVISIYEEVEADIFKTLRADILDLTYNCLSFRKTYNWEARIDNIAMHTKDEICNYFIKALKVRLSVDEDTIK